MTDPETAAIASAAALGAVLACAGNLAYLRDIRAGRTFPHRGAWLVWSVIAVVAALSHAAAGGRWSLAVLSVQGLGCLIILGHALRRGVGGITAGNLVLVATAGTGIAGWLALSDPIAATCSAALADAAALAGVVPKIWRQPDSETCSTYALASATGLLGALASQSTAPAVLIFPVYYCAANAIVTRLIIVRRRQALLAKSAERSPREQRVKRRCTASDRQTDLAR